MERSIFLNIKVSVNLKVKMMLTKGGLYHLLRVTYINVKVPTTQSVSVVCELSDFFPNEISGILQDRVIDFGIDVVPDTQTIFIPPTEWLDRVEGIEGVVKALLDKGFITLSVSPRGASNIKKKIDL